MTLILPASDIYVCNSNIWILYEGNYLLSEFCGRAVYIIVWKWQQKWPITVIIHAVFTLLQFAQFDSKSSKILLQFNAVFAIQDMLEHYYFFSSFSLEYLR